MDVMGDSVTDNEKLSKTSPDKRMTMKEAISKFVHKGDSLYIGLHETPTAAVHEIVRQNIQDLSLIIDSQVGPTTVLFGMGLINKVELAYMWGAIEGPSHVWRRAVEKNIPREVEVEYYSNYGMSLRLEAGARNIPFMPTRSQLGSDIIKHNPKIKTMEDPYGSGKPIALVPAVNPDVVIIHVHRADQLGNLQFFGHFGNADVVAKCGKRVIATCEEIISTEEIRRTPNLTLVPSYAVDAVVEVPFGAHWRETNYYYHHDFPFGMAAFEQWKTEDGFKRWCDKYIFGVDDWDGYCNKVGYDRLWKLWHAERKFQVYGEVR
jgi:glutaconate CoA-transferase subunit A